MSQWFRWFVGMSSTDRSIRLSRDDAFARDVAQRERNAVGWSHGRKCGNPLARSSGFNEWLDERSDRAFR